MDLIGTREAAGILGVNDSRVRQIIRTGRLKAHKVGKTLLLSRREVQAFAKRDRPQGRPKKQQKAKG